jgi:hypothetical protein
MKTPLERIKIIMDYYASMGVNKEKINKIYRRILENKS